MDTAGIARHMVTTLMAEATGNHDAEARYFAAAVVASYAYGSKEVEATTEPLMIMADSLMRGGVTHLGEEDMTWFDGLDVPPAALLLKAPVRCEECCRRYLCMAATRHKDDLALRAFLALAYAHAVRDDFRESLRKAYLAESVTEEYLAGLVGLSLFDGDQDDL